MKFAIFLASLFGLSLAQETFNSTLPLPALPLPTLPPAPVLKNVTCTKQIVRLEVRDMSASQWTAYVSAFKQMNEDGTLVNWHVEAWRVYHWNSYFLPFHRIYLLEFERELMARGAPFLPYWDSTWESQDPPNSVLFTEKYYGKNDGRYIVDGPFSRDSGYEVSVGGGPLIRDYSPEGTGAFYARSLIEDDIMNPIFSEFSKRLEIGQHSSIHSIIGGKDGHLAKPTSPEDPLFFVHHSFVDKLWDEQQIRYGHSYEGDAFDDFNATDTDVIGFGTWAMQIRDVIYNEDICVSYAEPIEAAVITDPSMPGANETETIRAPEIAINFLNGTGANITFVKMLDDETKKSVDKEQERINNQRASNGALAASISAGLVALAFVLV